MLPAAASAERGRGEVAGALQEVLGAWRDRPPTPGEAAGATAEVTLDPAAEDLAAIDAADATDRAFRELRSDPDGHLSAPGGAIVDPTLIRELQVATP